MCKSNEERIDQLCSYLVSILLNGEDVDSAIEVYKLAGSYIDRLEDVKKEARELAIACIDKGDKVKTIHGCAGWTDPKKEVLDKVAWAEKSKGADEKEAIKKLKDAQATLRKLQASCMVLPEGTFYIK